MDMSNRTLAMFLVAAIIVSIAGTFISLDKLGGLDGVPTAFATSDAGFVNLTIAASLNIRVNATNATLDYDSCVPDDSQVLFVDLGNSQFDIGSSWQFNCTGDSATNQYIGVENIGNVNANVSMRGDCTSNQLLGTASDGDVNFTSTGCQGGNVGTFEIATTNFEICGQVDALTTANNQDTFWVTSSVGIPIGSAGDTGGCGNDDQMGLTFYAQQI